MLIDRDYLSQLDSKQLLQSLESHFTELQDRGELPNALTFPQFKSITLDKMLPCRRKMRTRINVTKAHAPHNNSVYLKLKQEVSYEVEGTFGEPVFPNKLVVPEVELRIPEALGDSTPEEIYKFVSLRIDGRPTVVQVKNKREEKREILRYWVNLQEDFSFPDRPVKVQYIEEYAFAPVDFLVDPFLQFTTDALIECFHDESIEVDGYPFFTSFEYEEDAGEFSPGCFRMITSEAAWPGNGFSFIFKCVDQS